jgi:hypothetical protein
MVCKSLIMSVSSMLYVEELKESPLSDSDLKKGVEMLWQGTNELSNYKKSSISLCWCCTILLLFRVLI